MAGKRTNWIKKAVSPENKGKFREKAEKAGKSTAEFARLHDKSPGKLGKEARFAETMGHLRPKRKSPFYSKD